jgi:hypothetical protein
MASSSYVWEHFTKSSNKKEASCNLCKKVIQCSGGTTSGLRAHLEKRHDIVEAEPSQKKLKVDHQNKITGYLKKESIQDVVARMAAEVGLTIRQICRSKFIRKSLEKDGYKLPKSEGAVMGLVHLKNNEITDEIKNDLEKKLVGGQRFSLTTDEFTSLGNRRYMNIMLRENGGQGL